MSFEFTQDDLRSGQRIMLEKLANHVATLGQSSKEEVLISDLSEDEIKGPLWKKWQAVDALPEIDVESKVTIKDVAEAYNALLKAIKE